MADGEAAVRGRSGSQALAVNLTFNILASLRDYVILMNGSGHSIYTNKDITLLLRMKAPSLSGHVEPSQAEEVNLLQELECPELQADIRAMLKAGNDAQAPSSGTHHTVAHYSILCSDAHPDGLAIEYELSMPTIDQVRDGPRRLLSCPVLHVRRRNAPCACSCSSLAGRVAGVHGGQVRGAAGHPRPARLCPRVPLRGRGRRGRAAAAPAPGGEQQQQQQ